MLALLSSLMAGGVWLASHLWVLLVALIPVVLNTVQPVISAIVEGIRGYTSTVWQGATNSTWATWCLIFTVAGISFGLGYHYGWNSCLDFIHAHYHLASKMPVSNWWKFW